jgi:hypothetical protein
MPLRSLRVADLGAIRGQSSAPGLAGEGSQGAVQRGQSELEL